MWLGKFFISVLKRCVISNSGRQNLVLSSHNKCCEWYSNLSPHFLMDYLCSLQSEFESARKGIGNCCIAILLDKCIQFVVNEKRKWLNISDGWKDNVRARGSIKWEQRVLVVLRRLLLLLLPRLVHKLLAGASVSRRTSEDQWTFQEIDRSIGRSMMFNVVVSYFSFGFLSPDNHIQWLQWMSMIVVKFE